MTATICQMAEEHGQEFVESQRMSAIEKRINEIRWFHQIDLGNGLHTPGGEGQADTARDLQRMKLPEDLRGKSVLDVGAWDGFYSFEAERRGAKRVMATDFYCWEGPGWGSKEGFDLAHAALGSRVESKVIDVMDITPEEVGRFDVTLFLGVLYHLRHPLLALERMSAVTDDLLILATVVDAMDRDEPTVVFYPSDELYGDPTNWSGPNEAAVKAMLIEAGFNSVERVHLHMDDDKRGWLVVHAHKQLRSKIED